VPRSSRRLGAALAVAAAIVVADQAVKWVVRDSVARLPARLLPGVRIDLNYNSGISFGRLAGAGTIVTVLVAAVAAGVSAGLVLAPPRYRIALGIILGGALGNLIDRFRFGGAVADFIAIGSWPPFNLADAAILVGTVVLVIQVFRGLSD
jgi:signal peptidase II